MRTGHLPGCLRDVHWRDCPCQQEEAPEAEPTAVPDPLVKLRDVLDALRVTVVCHPADAERVRTAAADVAAPVRVVVSYAVDRGQLVTWTADQVRTWTP